MIKRYPLATIALIVLAIGILLVIGKGVMDRLTHHDEKMNREVQQKISGANLHMLRNAIDQFQADTGVYPVELTDLTAPETNGTKAGKTTVPANSYKGPYLTPTGGINNTGIPKNPYVDMNAIEPDPTLISTHWSYDPKTGKVEDPTGKIQFDPRFEGK